MDVVGGVLAGRGIRCGGAIAAAALAFAAAGGAAQAASPGTGFTEPFAGTPKYVPFAATQATSPAQINQPLGMKAAERVARGLGLNRQNAFTAQQYKLFVSGQGEGGKLRPAKLVDQSVRILTNTVGRPLHSKVDGKLTATVLGSYGLIVNPIGLLESPANATAPTRRINKVIAPGGYMATWAKANGAEASLKMLYQSAYTSEVPFGFKAQAISGAHQLVPNQQGATGTIVGMSMAPALWNVNFALIWTLNPSLAAKMPARWTPIPAKVALAIASSRTGQVKFSKYRSSFPGM